MKILFAVPSKNRAEILKKYTYQWLSLIHFDWKIFVEPQDMNKYSEFDNVISLPENNKGLGYSKKFIKEYAIQNGYDLIFKIDDDIKCFTDFRKRTSPEETAKLLEWFIENKVFENFYRHPILGAIAFPYSFHMFKNDTWKPAKKLQTAYICRTEFLTNDKYDFTVFEDFAVALDILVKGKKVMKYGLIGIELGVQVGGGTGGLQDFSRKELAEKDAENLRKMYPPLALKKVEKPWGIEPDIRSIKL